MPRLRSLNSTTKEVSGSTPHGWEEVYAFYEKILVGNLNNGERFETYVIPCANGSEAIELTGAAARLGLVDDLLVIMSFAQIDASAAKNWNPKVLVLKN